MLWLSLVVAAAAAGSARADFLNDYLNDKTFGAVPGPCENYADRCSFDWTELPPSVQDITVCVFGDNSGCGRIGDLVRGGEFEIWQLQCRRIGLSDASLRRTFTSGTRLEAVFEASGVRLSCSFFANVFDLVLEILGSFRIVSTITNTFISFPNVPGFAGTVDATVPLHLLAASPSGFATELPNRIELPAAAGCEIGVDLGLSLRLDQLDRLTLCVFIPTNIFTLLLPKGWQCANVVNSFNSGLISYLLNLFNIDAILSAIVRIIEAFVGGIICQIIEEFAVLQGPPVADGVLNIALTDAKAVVDEWALSPSLDPAAADAAAAHPQLAQAFDWGASAAVTAVSAGLNDWLGGPDLVINELVQLATEPDGELALDLVELGLAPEVLLPLFVANVTVRLESVALTGMDTFEALQILQTDGLSYSFRNQIQIAAPSFEVRIYTKLAPGKWVTAGDDEADFSFTFALRLQDLAFDAHNLVLFNLDELAATRVGQLERPLRVSDTPLEDLLACLAPALYQLNFTNLEASLGAVLDASVRNFDGQGLSQLIETSVEFGAAALRGALADKLPGIARGPLREVLNDVIFDLVNTLAPCPSYTPPPENRRDLIQVQLDADLLRGVGDFINGTVGGAPIQDTGADVNELVDAVLARFEEAYPGSWPLERQAQGSYTLAPFLDDLLRFPKFNAPNSFVHIQGLEIENLDSIYRLVVGPTGAGVLTIDAGIGGELGPLPAPSPTPLRLRVPVHVRDGVLDERFAFTLSIAEARFAIDVAALVLDANALRRLFVPQLVDPLCVLLALHELSLPSRLLSVSSIDVDLSRSFSSNNGDSLDAALDAIATGPPLPAPGGRFESLVNTVLQNGLRLALDQAEQLPQTLRENNVTAETCTSGGSLGFDLTTITQGVTNLTAYIGDVCLAPVAALPPLTATENAVAIPPGAENVFDFATNPLVGIFTGLVDQITTGGGLSAALVRIANSSSSSALTDAFQLDVDGDVDLLLPVGSFLGLRFENDDLIPGLVVDAGQLRLRKVNLLADSVELLKPISSYVTRTAVAFDTGNPLDAQLELSVQVAPEAVGEAPGGAPVREDVDISFRLTEFSFELQLLTAIDTDALGALTLGHFFTVDEATQAVGLSEFALDCAASVFFPGGIAVRRLLVQVSQIDQLSVASRTQQLLSADLEALLAAFVEVFFDFYKDAVENIAQNCVRAIANDYFVSLQAAEECPTAAEVAAAARAPGAPPLPGLLRFASSETWLLLQDLWQEFLIEDDFASLNTVLDGVFSGTVFFDESLGDELLLQDLALIYYGQDYGLLTLGLSNLRLTNTQTVSDLLIGRALDPAAEYDIMSRVGLDGPTSLAVDLRVNADKLFESLPDMQNHFRIEVSLTALQAAFLVRLRLNLTTALELEFATLATLERLPCVLIPIEELAPLDLNFSLQSVDLDVRCLSRCDLPMLAATSDAPFRTENGAQLAALLGDAIAFATSYLERVGAQDFLDAYFDSAERTCAELLAILERFFGAEPETSTVAATLGVSFAGILVASAALYALVYPVHKLRRKQALLRHLHDAERAAADRAGTGQASLGADDLARALTVTELEMKAPFQHPTVPLWVRALLPVCCLTNMALILVAVGFSGALSIVLRLTLLGAETTIVDLVPLTIPLLVNTIWQDLNKFIALVLAFSCVALPVLQNGLLLAIWFTPHTVATVHQKRVLLRYMELIGKMLFIIVLVLALTIAALYTRFSAADYAPLNGLLPSDLAGVEINVSPEAGMVLVAAVGGSSLILSHWVSFLLERSARLNRKRRDRIDPDRAARVEAQRAAGARAGGARPSAIGAHVFHGRDAEGMARAVRPLFTKVMVAASAGTAVLLLVSLFVPVITFEIVGVLGIVIEEVSTDSPTLEEPLQIRTLSLAQMGANIALAPQRDAAEVLAVVFLQLLYFVVFLVAPLIQLALMAACLLAKLSLRSARLLARVQRIATYWAALDVAVATVIGVTFIISDLVRLYVNFISEAVADDLCTSLEPVLAFLVPEQRDATCLGTEARLEPGIALAFLVAATQWALTAVFLVVSDAVLHDRYFAAYADVRTDAKPRKWPRAAVWLLKLVTQTRPAADKAQLSPIFATREQRGEGGDDDKDTAALQNAGFLPALVRYYVGTTNAQGETVQDETSRRIRQWQERFGTSSGSGLGDSGRAQQQPGVLAAGNPLFRPGPAPGARVGPPQGGEGARISGFDFAPPPQHPLRNKFARFTRRFRRGEADSSRVESEDVDV